MLRRLQEDPGWTPSDAFADRQLRGDKPQDEAPEFERNLDAEEMTDRSEILKLLGIPLSLHDSPCDIAVAETIMRAYNAVRVLGHWTRPSGNTSMRPQWHSAYSIDKDFIPDDLRYRHRPLVPYDRGMPLLARLLIPEGQDDGLPGHLRAEGFNEAAIEEIWRVPPVPRASPEQDLGPEARRASDPDQLREMTRLVWKEIYSQRERWFECPMGEIAGEIYHHCYLESDEAGDLTEASATNEDIEYLQGIAELYEETKEHYRDPTSVEIPGPGEPFNVDVWYQIGNPVGTRFRIYIHAKALEAVAVMRRLAPRIARPAAEGEKETDRTGIVAAKVASSRRAGQRPDTIVVYVNDSAKHAAELASELGGSLEGSMLPGEPRLTNKVQSGIGMAWDPQRGDPGGHSFGEYYSAILTEALYETAPVPSRRGGGNAPAPPSRHPRLQGTPTVFAQAQQRTNKE